MISTTKKRGSKLRLQTFFESERSETWNNNFEFENKKVLRTEENHNDEEACTENLYRELERPGTTTTKINMEWTRLRTRHDTFVLEIDQPEQSRFGNEDILRRPDASPCRKSVYE